MRDFTAKREAAVRSILNDPYEFDTTKSYDSLNRDIYGANAILHIMCDDDLETAFRMLKHAATWYEHEHPTKRDPRGEADFVAIRLMMAIYEPSCWDKLPDDVKDAVKTFLLDRDISSMHGSENHSFMFHVSRLLTAQRFNDGYFSVYNMSAKEAYDFDTQYVIDFINFRAGRSWGEFDSLGYTFEELLILNTLYKYTDNDVLRLKAKMIMDIIMLDMLADSIGNLYGGAHGRSYPGAVINRDRSGMAGVYNYYFGDANRGAPGIISYFSDYQPSDIIYEIEKNKKFPFENRERKHLHCMAEWMRDIKWDVLNTVTGSISKYTYVAGDYILGSVNRQEEYPLDYKGRGYARHQQQDWELTLPGGGDHKIFTHHLMPEGYYHINNRWTGDHGCCCGSYYTNKNTAMAMYNIKPDKDPVVNVYCPLNIFSEKILEDNYLFLEYGKLYISLYLSEGYRINKEDNYADKELICEGYQHAAVLRVEYKDNFESLSAFAESIKSKPVVFDKEAKTVSFDGIELRTDGNSEGGKENIYPYGKVYDCYFMQSEYDSKVIEIINGDKKVIYDFIQNKIIEA